MRSRYIFFTLVAIGDILDGTYLIYPTIMRIAEIDAGTFSKEISLWGCASKGYMMLRIYGTELVSLTMLVMAAEKVFAVFLPITYRWCITNKVRFIAAITCLFICLLSLMAMIFTSYFYTRTVVQQDRYCGFSGSVVKGFSQFHHLFNLLCQIGAFLGSTVVFLVARYFRKQANKKELISIKPILAVSFISCIVMSSNYIIYILKHFLKFDITKAQQHSVVTYSSALLQVSKFALYILAGREFRQRLWGIFKPRNCSLLSQNGTSTFLKKVTTFKTNT